MTQLTPAPQPEISRLRYTRGLRLWVTDIQQLPDGAARLLEAANRLEIVPHVIIFEYDGADDDWHVILLGEQ